jgi:hypothetical protein
MLQQAVPIMGVDSLYQLSTHTFLGLNVSLAGFNLSFNRTQGHNVATVGCGQTMSFDIGAAKHAGMTLIKI